MEIIIILLILGASLIFLETLLPGLITGIAGVICLLAAVILGYRDFGFQTGTFILGGVIVGGAIGIWCWAKYFSSSRVAKKFISEGAVGDLGVDKPELLNAAGVALTQLRPSGMAKIGNQRVDVLAESGLIERGTEIKVVAVEGMRVVVRAI